MITLKKLIKLAKQWQKMAANKRKRISFQRTTPGIVDTESCSTSSIVEKGHFVVYTADERRFMIPLKYLENNIIRELFKIAEDEFGLPGKGPIMLPCDAVFDGICSVFDPKACGKRLRECIAHVLSYRSLFNIVTSMSREPTSSTLRLLKQINS